MTATTLSVRVETNGAGSTLRAVLASMPNRFRLTDAATADVVAVAGGVPDVGEVVRATDCRAVVMTSPGAMTTEQFAELDTAAEATGCLLAPSLRFAPRFASSGSGPPTYVADVALIDSVIEAPSFNGLAAVDALLEQLAAVRQLVGPVGSVAVHHRSESSYVVGATIDGVAASVTLAGVASPIGADGLCLRVVGPHTRSDVEVDASTLARPARVSRFAGDGEHIERPVHQNSHRLTLQRVHELLTSGVGSLDYTAAELRQDLATAQVLAQP